jgi:hypothetical protein
MATAISTTMMTISSMSSKSSGMLGDLDQVADIAQVEFLRVRRPSLDRLRCTSRHGRWTVARDTNV